MPHQRWERGVPGDPILVTCGYANLRGGHPAPLKVTLTVRIARRDNQQYQLYSQWLPGGPPLKSAYVHGIRRLRDLKRGQVVRLAGSGAAVVLELWMEATLYFGRFSVMTG